MVVEEGEDVVPVFYHAFVERPKILVFFGQRPIQKGRHFFRYPVPFGERGIISVRIDLFLEPQAAVDQFPELHRPFGGVAFGEVHQFAQQVGGAQLVGPARGAEVARPAIVDQYRIGKARGKVFFDRRDAAVPREHDVGGRPALPGPVPALFPVDLYPGLGVSTFDGTNLLSP